MSAVATILLILVFLISLIELARHPNASLRDISLMLGALAGAAALFTLAGPLHLQALTVLGGDLLVAQPYLVLRLVAAKERIPRFMRGLALAVLAVCVLASWALPSRVVALGAVTVAAFILFNGYAALIFFRYSVRTGGILRRRHASIFAGTALLALALVFSSFGTLAGLGASLVQTLTSASFLISSLGFLLGFSPPRWLRRYWQLPSLYTFVESATRFSGPSVRQAALDRLAGAAAQIQGSIGAAVITQDIKQGFTIRHVTGPSAGQEAAVPDLGEGLLAQAWSGGQALQAPVERALSRPMWQAVAPPERATMLLAVPIATARQKHGLLLTFDDHRWLFEEDARTLLEALSTNTAFILENEQLLRQANENTERLADANRMLEQASRAKSEFLANMSHELRTPMNAILGFTEIMLDDEALPPDRRRHYLETVHSSGRHLLGLINDILDLSKVEAGRMELQVEDVDVAATLGELVATVRPLAAKAAVELTFHADVANLMRLDPVKLRQMVYNLLSNAIKFTPEGGSVSLEAAHQADLLTITVADTGPGIRKEDVERIFEAFQQVDMSLARRAQGTGLGLALTRKFAELHGGTVTVESQPGEGSRFTLELPAPAPEAPAPAAPATGQSGPLVLVVEDDVRAANLISLMLGGRGYRTAHARTAAEALEKALALSPSAITLDVILSSTDGWEVLRSLKEDPRLAHIPVVVVSILDEPAMALALGAADYFVKPVDRKRLIATLDKLVASGPKARVLAVDDDPKALELFEDVLAPEGYEVVSAGGGLAALDLARASSFDLILLDLMMPDMNGFDVLSALRSDPKTQDVPVVVVTAHDLSPENKAFLSDKVHCVLQKGSWGRSDLLDWLERATARSKEAMP